MVVALSIAIHLLTIDGRMVRGALGCGSARILAGRFSSFRPWSLVATIPISIAGWGVREGAMMTVFAYAGLLDADGLIVSILYGVGLFAVGAVGGSDLDSRLRTADRGLRMIARVKPEVVVDRRPLTF